MIHRMLTDQDTTRTTGVVYITRKDDESGIFQVKYAGSGTFTVCLEGRADPDADWYKVEEFDNTSSDDHNDLASDTTIASVVVMFPQMRVRLSATASTPSVSAWVNE